MLEAILAVSVILIGAPISEDRELIDRIVAIVNNDVITLSELGAAMKPFREQATTKGNVPDLCKDILDQLIAERLLSQQVKEAKITVSDDEVDRAIKDILRQNKITEDELKQALTQRGVSLGQYQEDLKSQLVRLKIVDMKVRSRVVIPEAEIKGEYERQTLGKETEEVFHIRHVFFRWGESPDPQEKKRVLAKANGARKRILKGEDFAKVAKELSEGPTAAQGGDLGDVGGKGLIPELKAALEGVKEGDVTTPIETPNGVHVVRLEGRKASEADSYESMRNAIYQQMYQKEVERQMKIWLDELKNNSAVQELTPCSSF